MRATKWGETIDSKNNKLAEILRKRKISCYRFTKMTSYTWNHIKGIMEGNYRPSLTCAKRIAFELNLKVKDIFPTYQEE